MRVLKQMAHLSLRQQAFEIKKMFKLRTFGYMTLHRMYKRHSISYRHPNYVYQAKLKRADEIGELQQDYSRAVVGHLLDHRRVVYIDETTFNAWMKKVRVWQQKEQFDV